MLGAVVFTLKFIDQYYIVNTAAPNMYTRPKHFNILMEDPLYLSDGACDVSYGIRLSLTKNKRLNNRDQRCLTFGD